MSRLKHKPSFLASKNGIILLALVVAFGVFYKWKKQFKSPPNSMQGVKNILKFIPDSARKKILSSPRSFGGIFVDGNLIGVGGSITENRILVRGSAMGAGCKAALSLNKEVVIKFLDGSTANVTKFLVSNDNLTVQMFVFEIDQPIGVPGKLDEQNKKILQDMQAF